MAAFQKRPSCQRIIVYHINNKLMLADNKQSTKMRIENRSNKIEPINGPYVSRLQCICNNRINTEPLGACRYIASLPKQQMQTKHSINNNTLPNMLFVCSQTQQTPNAWHENEHLTINELFVASERSIYS